ncbi:phosphatidylinositol-glycan-specific phospholipase D [Rhinatrema bivittatum]|uniref:phosphatidylinositol-glycan-specific phospholipase D n=1 Tax=Rhinatrema bivittatum TaxID=194408 RepID=UPI0011275014|nr:phosphatidylinositol-glycan-specific phospholipase D [Rhinatrema bivittatum]
MPALRAWSVLVIVICNQCLRTVPCGLSTHIEIAHRALEFFSQRDEGRVDYRELLLKHQDAYQAGSVYPDAFYPGLCKNGIYHEVSEDTHWAPFLNTSIHYIRKNYPQPWEEDTERLVAFLFGIASHMVADVSWHSLGIEQGFLRTMAAIDFQGSYPEAHSTGDFGGDVLSQFELDFHYLAKEWYLPVQDLMKIYEEFYGRKVISESTIIDCTYMQFLEMYGEVLAVSKLFSSYAKKSPFLVERFHEYFLGGVDDMAFWTTELFQLTGHMLDNGTSDCFIPENPLFLRCDSTVQNNYLPKRERHGYYMNMTFSLMQTVGADIIFMEKGVSFRINSWAQNSVHFINKAVTAMNMKNIITAGRYPNHITEPSASYYLTTPYARLGWAMTSADLNQDGYDDLVIGAPGYSTLGRVQVGRLYIVYSNESGLPPRNMDLDEGADARLQGFQPSGRFGSAVAALDFNADGVMDLAVGAPSVGSGHLQYVGSVYVYFGTRYKNVSAKPNVTITCKTTYCNLGWSLLAADINGDGVNDLVVGSPYAPAGGKQKGIVAGFFSSTHRNGKDLLSVKEADWFVKGEQDYSWFGYSLHSLRIQNRTLLLIGSPTWKTCASLNCKFSFPGKQSVGRMYGYYPPSRNYMFAVSGNKEQSKLGSSFASGFVSVDGIPIHALVVGAPTQDSTSRLAFISTHLPQAGATFVYELEPATAPSYRSSLSGDRRFSRFGGDVHLSDLDHDELDEIIVSSPLRSDDITSVLYGTEAGRVYIFNGNKTISGQMTDTCQSWISPCPEDWAQYVLISPEDKSRFGSNVITVKSGQKNEVVVAAERSSMKATLSGALHVYSL